MCCISWPGESCVDRIESPHRPPVVPTLNKYPFQKRTNIHHQSMCPTQKRGEPVESYARRLSNLSRAQYGSQEAETNEVFNRPPPVLELPSPARVDAGVSSSPRLLAQGLLAAARDE